MNHIAWNDIPSDAIYFWQCIHSTLTINYRTGIKVMTRCAKCNSDVPFDRGQCPQCGATVGGAASELECEVRSLLAQERKIEAVKLYRERTGTNLLEAKNAVEAIEAGAIPPPADGSDLESELMRHLRKGETLAAVALYSQRKGVSQVDAEQAIELLAAKAGLESRRAGCLGVLAIIALVALCAGMTSL